MKPKDLTYPFRFKDRKLISENGIFYLPDYLETYEGFDPGLPLNKGPLFVEFCSGNGEWIIQKAQENPEVQFIAVEKLFPRVQKIYSKMKNLGIENLFIVSGDIHLLLTHFLPPACIDHLAINFPDPWPKDRHVKHRLFHEKFVRQIETALKEDAELFLVTDDAPFSDWVSTALKDSLFSLEKRGLRDPIPNYGSSFFQRLWESKGLPIFYHHYLRRSYAGCKLSHEI
ncbi:MAG: tRNA (guanosine(46)-N7)-methyltransferase TrmB [Chlamydiia bacterium]